MTWLKRLLTTLALLSCAAVAAFFLLGPRWVDSASNQVVGDPGRRPTPPAMPMPASFCENTAVESNFFPNIAAPQSPN
mgnify:CR=1 FL=1